MWTCAHTLTRNVFTLFLFVFDCSNKHINATDIHECFVIWRIHQWKTQALMTRMTIFTIWKTSFWYPQSITDFLHMYKLCISVWNWKTKQMQIFPKLRCAYNHSASKLECNLCFELGLINTKYFCIRNSYKMMGTLSTERSCIWNLYKPPSPPSYIRNLLKNKKLCFVINVLSWGIHIKWWAPLNTFVWGIHIK